jgi:signal transduction histidine kinase
MTDAEAAGEQSLEFQRSFISAVFHNLSQPLTALHCVLDLSLRHDQTTEELRGSIQTALENAERLRQRLLLVRALSDASDSGDISQPVELRDLLRELQEDMLPLFDSAGKRLEVKTETEISDRSLLVRGNRTRLLRALFCFVEYLLRYSPKGSVLSLRVAPQQGRLAELRIEAASCFPLAPATENSDEVVLSCEIELARRSLRAAGGELTLLSALADHSSWRATLPLA